MRGGRILHQPFVPLQDGRGDSQGETLRQQVESLVTRDADDLEFLTEAEDGFKKKELHQAERDVALSIAISTASIAEGIGLTFS